MKQYARIIVAVTLLFGLGVAANAETVVTLPFKFVVSGKTLPAGTYTVSRLSNTRVLMFTSHDNGNSVFVHAIDVESTSADTPYVSFKHVGAQYLLSRIQSEDYVYKIHVPRSVIMAAAARPQDNVSVSGSSGGN
jgi:hypothetical protein